MARPPGHWRLYRRCDRRHRAGSARQRGGRQCRTGDGQAHGGAGPATHSKEETGARCGALRNAGTPRRLGAGADGSGCDGLHAAFAEVRGMPADPCVSGRRHRPGRGFSTPSGEGGQAHALRGRVPDAFGRENPAGPASLLGPSCRHDGAADHAMARPPVDDRGSATACPCAGVLARAWRSPPRLHALSSAPDDP